MQPLTSRSTGTSSPFYDVFISFRGGDRELARRLRDGLARRSNALVFHDERSIPAGVRWAEYIEDAAVRSRSMIALIGPAWGLLDTSDAVDWVRRELDLAVVTGIPILPVIVGNPRLREQLATLPD